MTSVPTVNADALLVELVATPEGRADPYSRYAALREVAPVHGSALGFWILTRFDDCQQVLRDARLGKDFSGAASAIGITAAQQAEQALLRSDHSNMLFADPPDHTRLRGLVNRAFTPRTAEALRPRVTALVKELVDRFAEGPVELMGALAFPLPVTVIGEMLGVPEEDRPQFRSLVRATTALLELATSPEAMTAAIDARHTLEAYFGELVVERRAHTGDDLLSGMIAADDGGDRLSERELVSTAILLFAAGFETTTNLLGNAVLALLDHPDQLERLRADRGLVRPAVEEVLRWDSPVQVDARSVYDGVSVEVGGHLIEGNTTVLTLLGAANRDPARFADPERFDVGRDEGPSLAFGTGIHHCLGAALARIEGQVVLEHLLDRFGTWQLAGDRPRHRDSLTLRGLIELPVRFAA